MESSSRCSGCEQAAFCVGLHEEFLHCQFSLFPGFLLGCIVLMSGVVVRRGRLYDSVNLQPIWLEVVEILVEVYQVRCASRSGVFRKRSITSRKTTCLERAGIA